MGNQMEKLELKEIPQCPGYFASKDGSIWSNKGKNKSFRKLSWRKARHGYACVGIHKEKKQYTKYVHRLTALAWIPNHKNKDEINHIDGNKTNNNIKNLEWVTKSENAKHSTVVLKNNIGSKHKLSKLTEDQAKEIKSIDGKHRDIGKKYGISHCMVGRIKRGLSWSHIK